MSTYPTDDDLRLIGRALPTPGRTYNHYKGTDYRIVVIAKQESSGELCVVYEKLDKSETWIRPLLEFLGRVDVDGIPVWRFA